MFQRVGASAYKVDLSNTVLLMDYLNQPQKGFKSVHVAGTNGKGSTSHMIASVLQEAGYKVGLYTSPHLKDFRERVKINGAMISEEAVMDFVFNHRTFFESHQLSFFEMTVGLAFSYFKKEKVDIAIIEVGLGGRLDSTNVISPEVSVITNIGLDHTKFLGNTLEKIAFEKTGIIKNEIPVVIGEFVEETLSVFKEVAKKNNTHLVFAEKEAIKYETDLLGEYQIKNCATAVTTCKILRNKGWNIDDAQLKEGLVKVVQNTGLLGRWQILQEKPKVICDTAHNKEGLSWVLPQLKREKYERLHIVLGVVDDKNLDTILLLFPKNASYYFCKPNVIRGLDAVKLKDHASKYEIVGEVYNSVNEAYTRALKNAEDKDVIYVGGSTFVVAEIL